VRQWLDDALQSAKLLKRHIGDTTYEAFQQDDWTKGAVERRLEVIGEALRRTRDANPEVFEDAPLLHEWIALRNFISHQYDGINEFAIWTAATEELDDLIETLQHVIERPTTSDVEPERSGPESQ
jgi:uncharacterized protein with HEPN domain